MMFSSILVVCQGNICRSPMAEWLLRERLDGKQMRVASAGVTAMVGHPAAPEVIELLQSDGIDATAHRAQQCSPALVSEFDLILAMERIHVEALTRLEPASRGKTKLLGHWAGGMEIPDPYRRSMVVYRGCYQQIRESIDQWLPYLD